MLLLWIAAATAQDSAQIAVPTIDTQVWRLPIDARHTLWAQDTKVERTGWWLARAGIQWIDRPFVWQWEGGDAVPIVRDALQLDLAAGVALGPVRVGLDLPLIPVATSDIEGLGGGGIGDLALDVKGQILDIDEAPVGLGVDLRLGLPTGGVAGLSSAGASWAADVLVDRQVTDQVFAVANLGLRGTKGADLDVGVLKTQLVTRLGVGWSPKETWGLSADLQAVLGFGTKGAGSPVELLVGGWGHATENLVIRGGVGTGLNDAVGAPSFRALVIVGWEPPADVDTDGDLIVDRKDACPEEPEDKDQFEDADGCIDPDDDKDTILDVTDACRLVAEDLDGWKDEDGCPDPGTRVHVILVGDDGKPVPTPQTVVSNDTAREIGDDDFSIELAPGLYVVTAEAKGYLPLKKTMTVPDQASAEFQFVIDRDLPPGILRIKVIDPTGKPIEGATLTLNDGTPEAFEAGGVLETMLPAQQFAMMVRAEGYKPETRPIEVKPGTTEDVLVKLTPAKVKVTRDKLDIRDKIFFEVDKAIIKPESYPLLDEIAGILLDRPDILKMRVEGHTDDQGNDAYNLTLSANRAAAVKAYLVDKGVEASRFDTVGYGETRPLVPGTSKSAREKNRRVEFFITQWAE